ncbi:MULTISPECIES: questin oxidase family protein [Microbulbifer]|uniref:questin oxidase family protein n=1 Tax=Microbulbifer TaxID=48073 RepID=UPI001F157897|nr:questin oxidase family protein [Microbulbifer zhoushanensis]
MAITRYCTELLESASRFHVHYGDRLANHLPMVLIALDQMGATREQLQYAFDRSTPHLQLRPASPVKPVSDITTCRHSEELFPSALQYYEQQLEQHGIADCLRRELPPLLPSIATAAFHGLIRTAYGIDARHLEEVAMGLAYWNLEYYPLESSGERTDLAAAEVIADVSQRYPQVEVAPGNISDHMHAVMGQDGWMDTPIQPRQLGLEDIAAIALKAYAGTGSFTLLHGVTGCHALRLILPYCPDREVAMRYFWEGLVIAYLSTGPEPIVSAGARGDAVEQVKAWQEIREKACRSDDDHIIKLSYSCQQEFEFYENAAYRHVASSLFE